MMMDQPRMESPPRIIPRSDTADQTSAFVPIPSVSPREIMNYSQQDQQQLRTEPDVDMPVTAVVQQEPILMGTDDVVEI